MPEPTDQVLRTVADELLELVKKNNKISIEEAAKRLKMPIATVQALVDFLVEERVFGIEYKFTTPYVYIYSDGVKNAKAQEKTKARGLITKEQFYDKAKSKDIPHEHIGDMWRKYLEENLTRMREEFYKKSREKKIPEERIEELWKRYLVFIV